MRKRLYRGVLLFVDVLRHPWAYLSHRLRSRVVAGPGLLGFSGGVFNPGAIRTEKGEIILLAKAQIQHWLYADASDYMRGAPVVFFLQPSLRVDSSEIVECSDRFQSAVDTEIEDFRLFRFAGEIWVNHNLIETVRTEKRTGYKGSRTCISRLDHEKRMLTFLGHPQIDFDVQPREKNWAYAELENELYLFYSFHPYRVLKLADPDNLSFSTIINRTTAIDFADLGGVTGFVSYSTNPVSYDDEHLLVVVHQSVPRPEGRCYYHWGVLLDKTSLSPIKVTARPLVSGLGARGVLRSVLYVSSIIESADSFVLFCGEGDTYVTRLSIPKRRLDRLWSVVAHVC